MISLVKIEASRDLVSFSKRFVVALQGSEFDHEIFSPLLLLGGEEELDHQPHRYVVVAIA